MQNDGSAIISSPPSGNNFGTADNVSPLKQFFRNKWVKLIIAIDIIAVIAVIAILINNATKTAVINFNVAPVDAKIQLGGQGDYGNGSYQVHPGNYEITITRDGLEPKTFNLDLQSGYNTTLTAFLKGANDNFDFYTYKVNYDSLQKLISIASEGNNQTTDQDSSAEAFIAGYQKAAQLYNMLPMIDKTPSKYGEGAGINYEYDILKIADGSDLEKCSHVLCLYITDTSGEKEEFALSVIEKFGYNPNSYQIIYEKVPYEKN